MENGASGGEGQGNTHLVFEKTSLPPLKDQGEVRKAWSKNKHAQRFSCKPRAAVTDPSRTAWALMTSGDVRRFNHEQVRSAEGALRLAPLRHKWPQSRGSSWTRTRGRKAADAQQYPIKQSAKPYEGTKSSQGRTKKGSNINFISVLSAGDTLHISFQ